MNVNYILNLLYKRDKRDKQLQCIVVKSTSMTIENEHNTTYNLNALEWSFSFFPLPFKKYTFLVIFHRFNVLCEFDQNFASLPKYGKIPVKNRAAAITLYIKNAKRNGKSFTTMNFNFKQQYNRELINLNLQIQKCFGVGAKLKRRVYIIHIYYKRRNAHIVLRGINIE